MRQAFEVAAGGQGCSACSSRQMPLVPGRVWRRQRFGRVLEGVVVRASWFSVMGSAFGVWLWGALWDRLVAGATCEGGLGILPPAGTEVRFGPLFDQGQVERTCPQCAALRFPSDVVDILYFRSLC